MRRTGRGFGACLLAAVIGLGTAQVAGAVLISEREFTAIDEQGSFAGTTGNRAIFLHVGSATAGQSIDLTASQGTGSLSYASERKQTLIPQVDDSLLAACDHPQALTVEGTRVCLDAEELSARGVDISTDSPTPSVGITTLVNAGVAQLIEKSELTNITGQDGAANTKAFLVSNVAYGEATCSPSKGSDEIVGLAAPDDVKPVVDGQLAVARCSLSATGFPSASHETGEALLDVTLNETIFDNDSMDLLNGLLDDIDVGNDPLPDEVETPLDNAINEIQTSLNEQPVVRVRVAPTRGEILGSDPGMEATSIARGVTIDILPLDVDIPFGDLNGIAQITIGEASAAAAVKDGQAIASNAAALVHVKVLNITTDDPDDVLLETTLPLPDQSLGSVDQVLLAGTPLQTTIKAASAPDPVQTCQQDGDRRRCEASAEADSFTVSIFDPVISDPVVGSESNPLPNITLEVASAQAAVVGTVQAAGAQPFLPIVLARTGALPLMTVLSGALLTMGALAVRRRFSR